MENPFKRLRKLTLISQKDFAAKYQFALTTMTYIESGQYPDLSDGMITSLGRECHEKNVDAAEVLAWEYGISDLQGAYHAWQAAERQRVATRLARVPVQPGTEARSPFQQFVLGAAGSRQAFCKLLKVPAASVQRYATGYTRSMPKVIEHALREVHYPHLSELLYAQERWLDAH